MGKKRKTISKVVKHFTEKLERQVKYYKLVSRYFDNIDYVSPFHYFLVNKGKELLSSGYKVVKVKQDSIYKPLQCHNNTLSFLFRNYQKKGYYSKDLQYTEGIGVSKSVGPQEHGFIVNHKRKEIIDPTWNDGLCYYGLTVPLDFLLSRIMGCGVGYQGTFRSYDYENFYGKYYNLIVYTSFRELVPKVKIPNYKEYLLQTRGHKTL